MVANRQERGCGRQHRACSRVDRISGRTNGRGKRTKSGSNTSVVPVSYSCCTNIVLAVLDRQRSGAKATIWWFCHDHDRSGRSAMIGNIGKEWSVQCDLGFTLKADQPSSNFYDQQWHNAYCTISVIPNALRWIIQPTYAYTCITLRWKTLHMMLRAAQFSFRPGDYLPLHFGLNFRNPSYIYIRACCIVYICSLYHSVHKFTINNPNLCIIDLEIFNWKYWFDNLSGHLLRPSED